MKSFLFKIGILSLFLIGCFGILNFLLPPYWGNEIISSKIQYLHELKHNKFDTYFIGSSRVNTQLDPKVFNEKTGSTAFNIGCPALSGFETLDIANYLLDDPKLSRKLKYLIIESPLLVFNKGKNVQSVRGSYFFDFEKLKMSVANLKAEGSKNIRIYKKILFQSSVVMKNFFKLGTLSTSLKYFYKRLPVTTINRYKSRLGYSPLKISTKSDSELARRKELMRDTSILTTRLREAKTYIAKKQGIDKTNEFLLSKLQELITKAEDQGVHLHVVLFPKSNGIIYKKSMNVFSSLPSENTMNLAKPGKFKDFYFTKLSFDKAHLNSVGSAKLTTYLAEEFLTDLSYQ